MRYYTKTDIGMVRSNNQDSVAAFRRGTYTCAVVCDGMGGANGGNIASSMAVSAFCEKVRKNLAAASPDELTGGDLGRLLQAAVEDANDRVYNRALYEPGLEGMGTTLVGVIASEDGAVAINVGDSRIYALKGGKLEQISRDHSFVQYLIDRGAISRGEAKHHPNRNIILKAVGISENIDGEVFYIRDFDYLLLCTDGLTNHVEDFEIQNILSGTPGRRTSVTSRIDSLIALANSRGGTDNITVAIIGR